MSGKIENQPDASAEVKVKNGLACYRGTRPLDEMAFPPEPATVAADYDWATQDLTIRQEYGGLVVAVRQRQIWGAGQNYRAAQEQACQAPGCPPLEELVFVVVPGPALPGRRLLP